MGLAEPVFVKPPGFDVTVYSVIVEPPLLTGGVNAIVASAFPFAADTPVGAPGTAKEAEGVTEFEAALAVPVPLAFVAVTVKVYAVPLASPVMVTGLVAAVPVIPPGLEVAI
jgi:hypothetical protein